MRNDYIVYIIKNLERLLKLVLKKLQILEDINMSDLI